MRTSARMHTVPSLVLGCAVLRASAGFAQSAGPEPDGNDDPAVMAPTTDAAGPNAWRFVRVGRAPRALRRICDLRVHGDALYAAHANQPLGSDGATVSRYGPDAAGTLRFSVAFDWNRPGQPTAGGGAGQGFLRVRRIDGRLFVPDSDPPYAGFGRIDPATEGYVFVSDRDGRFAPARGARLLPPSAPDATARAGAAVLPRAYHVIDVARYQGRLYASTGSVPPRERAWRGPSPGALHLASESLSRWNYQLGYPVPYEPGVWRLGFLTRFRGRLYAGIQDYDGREPNDYVVFAPSVPGSPLTQGDGRGVRATAHGGALTLRWFADAGRLYWIALERDGRAALRVSDDGERWREIALPAETGRPSDVTRFRGALVVLTERGLYRLANERAVLLARVDEARSPFVLNDAFCAAPLAVYRDALYAGGQRDGALYRLDAQTPLSAAPH